MLLLSLILSTSMSHAGDYEKVWEWNYTSPPNIVICNDAKTSASTVKKAVTFWKSKGYNFGTVYSDNGVCNKDYHSKTVMITGERSLDTDSHHAMTIPWFNSSGKLVSVVIGFEDTSANNLELVTHELGHSLGIDHAGDADDIMYAYRSY
jgi:hypothetical protein